MKSPLGLAEGLVSNPNVGCARLKVPGAPGPVRTRGADRLPTRLRSAASVPASCLPRAGAGKVSLCCAVVTMTCQSCQAPPRKALGFGVFISSFSFLLFLFLKAVVKRKRCREPLGAPRLLSCWIPGGVQLPLQSSQPLLTHCALAGWSILASCSASSAEQGSNWNSSSNGGPSSFFCDPERRLSE